MLIRRSILIIPASNADAVATAWSHDADAVILDIQAGVPLSQLAAARASLPAAIAAAGQGGADVLVRVNAPYWHADSDAAVCPALTGIVLPGPESPQQVADADAHLGNLELQRGIPPGRLELALSLETAAGVWHIRELMAASPRIKQVAIDEAALAAALGIVQNPSLDPFVYARGRLCIEATAIGVQPVAVLDPTRLGGDELSYDDKLQLATDARNLGFKGLVCVHPHWISAVNAAFTPTESLVDYYVQVREVFAQALAAGTAAAPFAGRMIDVPVDERAKDVLALSAACAARDAAKQAALASSGQQTGP